MKKYLAALAIVGAYLFFTSSAASQSQLFRIGADQTMMLVNPDNENSGGTGFAVKTEDGVRYTLSNAHVCEIGQKRGFMLAKKGNLSTRLRIIAISDNSDLCLLEALPGLEGLELAEEVSMFEGVYLVGHPLLMPISITAGWVRGRGVFGISYCNVMRNNTNFPRIIRPQENDVDDIINMFDSCVKMRAAIITNNFSRPGNSGSAVLNDDGDVVGVLFAGDSEGTSLMVPLSEVKTFLTGY